MTSIPSTKLNTNFLKIISILCACLVPLLITGPFIPDTIVSCLSFWFLYYTLKNKIYNIFRNIYFYFFIGFWIVCILSSLLSDNILLSLKASLFYVRIGIFALLISYLINQDKKILDYFYYAFVITFSFIIIDGYFQYFTHFNLFGYPIHNNRISSFFGSELILGSYLARLFPLFFALFIIRPNKSLLEVYLILIFIMLIYILTLLSGERASFFFFNLSILLLIIFVPKHKFLKITFSIILLFLVTFVIVKNDKLYDRYIVFPIETMGLNKEEKYFFTPAHDSLIKTAWNMFLDKPILGHGPKLFRIKCSDTKYSYSTLSCDRHPHNFYIQLLAETGIIGFLFLMGVFFYCIYLLINHKIQYFFNKRIFLSDYQICLLSGLLITTWPITSNGNFFTNYLMLFYSLQIGFFFKNVK